MAPNTITGLAVLTVAVVCMIWLVRRSNRIIARLTRTRPRSVREALKDLRDGR